MIVDEAIKILETHNQWRKGADIPMESPVRLGMAIDIITCELKTFIEEDKLSLTALKWWNSLPSLGRSSSRK
jgi:hypothetical protein